MLQPELLLGTWTDCGNRAGPGKRAPETNGAADLCQARLPPSRPSAFALQPVWFELCCVGQELWTDCGNRAGRTSRHRRLRSCRPAVLEEARLPPTVLVLRIDVSTAFKFMTSLFFSSTVCLTKYNVAHAATRVVAWHMDRLRQPCRSWQAGARNQWCC